MRTVPPTNDTYSDTTFGVTIPWTTSANHRNKMAPPMNRLCRIALTCLAHRSATAAINMPMMQVPQTAAIIREPLMDWSLGTLAAFRSTSSTPMKLPATPLVTAKMKPSVMNRWFRSIAGRALRKSVRTTAAEALGGCRGLDGKWMTTRTNARAAITKLM